MKKACYWKVVLHYGHVGSHKEISVARYLYFKDPLSLVEVCDFAKEMPGVKHSQMLSSVKQVTREDFLIGKKNEKTDFFLIKLQSLIGTQGTRKFQFLRITADHINPAAARGTEHLDC